MTDVMAKVQQVKYLMPVQAQDPVILKATGQTTAVMYIGFSSDELSSAAISDYLTRVVQPLMATVDGVASADILGGQTFAMRLWLDPATMAALRAELEKARFDHAADLERARQDAQNEIRQLQEAIAVMRQGLEGVRG